MAADRLAKGTVIGDAYRIVRPLSAGGMGEVYVAEQLSTGKLRALKLMHHRLQADAKLRERFVKEARVASSIESAHVVEVIGAGVEQESGTPWLAMELLEGEDLGAHVRRQGALPFRRVSELLEQICHALAEAHQAGIVHRDLKPENIFIAKSKTAGAATTVKILDFGIAKLVAEAQTMGTSAVGSPAWMSPEQAEAGSNITPATDVWALGLLSFWMLTGSPYWRTAGQPNVSMHAFLKEILFEALPRASQRASDLGCADRLPEGFDDWFERCVHREPAARFRSAGELMESFRDLEAGQDVAATDGATPDAPAASADLAPMSTRSFISSGEVGTLPLEELPTEAAPPADEPAADEPAADEPAADEPAADEPADHEPAADEQEPVASAAAAPAPSEAANEDAVATRAPVVASPIPQPANRRRRSALIVAGVLVLAATAQVVRSTGESDDKGVVAAPESSESAPEPMASETAAVEEPSADAVESATTTASSPSTTQEPRLSAPSAPHDAASASASASAEADVAPPFNRFVNERLVQQRAGVPKRLCARHQGPRVIDVTLRFGNDGTVKALDMPASVSHTATGMCVKLHLQNVTVPRFSGPEESIKLTINLD